VTVFRTLWIEEPENRAMVFEDRMNEVRCPKCGHAFCVAFPFLATNVPGHFAVWYEPYPDPQIDEEAAGYEIIFGPGNFYAEAPRIADWEEFKATIEKYERGELEGQPPTRLGAEGLKEVLSAYAEREEPRKRSWLSRLFGRG
jgi:hypothetical protein